MRDLKRTAGAIQTQIFNFDMIGNRIDTGCKMLKLVTFNQAIVAFQIPLKVDAAGSGRCRRWIEIPSSFQMEFIAYTNRSYPRYKFGRNQRRCSYRRNGNMSLHVNPIFIERNVMIAGQMKG